MNDIRSKAEIKGDSILNNLAEAFNEYIKEYGTGKDSGYDNDTIDFRNAIYTAQRIILAKQAIIMRPMVLGNTYKRAK